MKALYLKSDNCPVCKDFLPKFILICNEYNIPHEIVDVSNSQKESGQMLVFSVPTIIFLNKENQELIRFSGYFGGYEIRNFLDRYYSTD